MNRKILVFLISIFSCLIIVFCILGFFNHPQSDDYSFALAVKQFGFFNAQQYWFTHWSGRFFSNFLASFQPLLANMLFVYKILPTIFIVLLFLSLKIYIKPFLKNENFHQLSFIYALTIVLIWLNQNPALSESLYWFTGFVNYILPIPFALFLLTKLLDYKTKLNKYQSALCLISVIILAGSSELFLIFDLFWASLWILLRFQNKKISFLNLFIAIELILLLAFVVISKGNHYRSSIVNTYQQPIGVAAYSFFYTLRFLIYVFENGSLIVFTLWMLLLVDVSKFQNFNKKYALYFFAYFLFFIWVSIAFVVWFTGDKVPSRYLASLQLLVSVVVPLFFYALISKTWIEKIKKYINKPIYKVTLFVLFVLFLFMPGRSTLKFNHPLSGNLYSITKVLLNGDAAKFDAEMDKRYSIFEMNKGTHCVVPQITYIKEIQYLDIISDTSNWYNVKVAGFFGLKSVKTDEENFDLVETQKVQY